MNLKLFTFLLIIIPNILLAQHSISGIVKDNNNGVALHSATVLLQPTSQKTVTDKDGKFIFYNVPSGKYAVTISFIGYKSIEKIADVSNDAFLEIALTKAAITSSEVLVSATRADEKTGMAFTNLDKAAIEKQNFGQDIPFILALTPSVVVTSDAGNGIGYTGIRIRGSDATRINVTVNDVPINDAESQQMYWVDLPDIGSSIESVQIQRGVGTSTNGAGAFGGSINVQTNALKSQSYLESNHAVGSFGTFKNNISFGTGLLDDKWVFDARLSKINSDGYIDRATSNLKSIYISPGYYGKKSVVRLNIFSGSEITYQSWNGTPEARIKNDEHGMVDFADRNGLDEQDLNNLLKAGRTYNFYTYKDQVDNYQQDNFQLHYSLQLSDKLNLNTALHYTKGKGYYEEYKKHQDLAQYGIIDFIPSTDDVSLVRRKWLANDFYGAIYSLQYNAPSKIKAAIGGGWNQYGGDHYDEIIFSQNFPYAKMPYRYSDNDALKTDFNVFAKAAVDLNEKINLFADLQFRRIGYHFTGFDEVLNFIPQKTELIFFNPKGGLYFQVNDNQSAYLSVSVGNKEPSRDDYVDSSPTSRPKTENLVDFEGGWRFHNSRYSISFNGYFMNYKNQLVLTGEVNDVGNYTRTNIDKSYRTGLEAQLSYKISDKFHFTATATVSRNKIKEYKNYVDNYDSGNQLTTSFKNTDISFSPSLTASSIISYEFNKHFSADFISKYTGQQFLDNTSDKLKKLKPYFINDARLGYIIHTKVVREIKFGVLLNNIFNHLYESNGYTYSYVYGGSETVENFYFPQAGTNVLMQVSLKF